MCRPGRARLQAPSGIAGLAWWKLFRNQLMDIVHLIQSAVAPVFLLSGVGVTLGVLTGRLARIIDRARYLEEQEGKPGVHAESIHASLRMLARRAKYTNAAIAMCAAS